MNITLLTIGKMKDAALASLCAEYMKRLSAFAKVQIVEVKDEADVHSDRPAEAKRIKDTEAARALEKISQGDYVILLDLHGRQWSSEEFAAELRTWQERSQNLVFVIAGSLGPGEALVQRANVRWQLSRLTYTHLMTRVLVLEQIYRAYMINTGRNYHK